MNRFPDPQPAGVHAKIIEHLDAARALMDQVPLNEVATLADPFDRTFGQMLNVIVSDYQRHWFETATARPAMPLPDDLRGAAITHALANETFVRRTQQEP